ncbi:YhgE/Pip N-terminal domain [Rothia kristinae]|nr:YhgE/Pip N-terminal domain [Rothia kristinae]
MAPGELLLLQASGQLTRTALALVLTGRMKPESGSITWNEESSRKALRRHASIVDAPELNEMEKHMRVRDYVSEMLSYMPHPFLQRPHSGRWLEENGLADLNNLWDEQLTGEQRIRLMTALARHNSGADLLVFDTPSRHAHYSVTWIPRLLELAQDEEHPRAVIAVVPHVSDKWYGPVAIEGTRRAGADPTSPTRRRADATGSPRRTLSRPPGCSPSRSCSTWRPRPRRSNPRATTPTRPPRTRTRRKTVTSLRLALTELKRFSHGVLPKLVMLAVTLVPLLYGGVYLYSNWNPYGRVDNVSAALVQSDRGATDESGKHVNTGEDVAKELKDAGNFDWQDVSTRQEAVDKVEKGELGFALVIPSDFSQKLLSTSRFQPDENGKTGEVDPQKAGLEIITNDANNYLLTNIVEKAGTSVRDTVASQVGDETANQLLASFTDIHGQLVEARDGSQKVTDGTVQLGSAIDRLKGGTSDLVSGSQRLNSGAHQLHDAENQLVDGQRQGLDGAQQLDDGAQQLDSATGQLADGTGQLRSGAGQLKDGTQQLADGSGQLKDGTATLAQGATQLKDGTAQLSSGATQLKDGTAQLSSGATQLKDGTGKLVTGATQLDQGIGQLDTQLKESGISQVGDNLTGVCRTCPRSTTRRPPVAWARTCPTPSCPRTRRSCARPCSSRSRTARSTSPSSRSTRSWAPWAGSRRTSASTTPPRRA